MRVDYSEIDASVNPLLDPETLKLLEETAFWYDRFTQFIVITGKRVYVIANRRKSPNQNRRTRNP